MSKQAIIVLREELEYFSIPPKESNAVTNSNGIANDALLDLKRKCGTYLLHKRNIFTALQRNVHKENNVAEQHLIDMLCMRSFSLLNYLHLAYAHMIDATVVLTVRTSGDTVLWSLRGAVSRQ